MALPPSAHRGADGMRSSPSAARREAAPPDEGASQILACDFSGTELVNAIVRPSGDQRGELSPVSWSEIFVSDPPVTPLAPTTQTSVLCPPSNALPVRSETNAMLRLSGDHCGSASFQSSPEVICA